MSAPGTPSATSSGRPSGTSPGTLSGPPPTGTLPYEVYAVRYGTVARRASENFIGADPHEAGARMDYFVWLVRNAQRSVVIDTGFTEQAARERKRDFLRPPTEGLRLLGIDGATVNDVILTHLHYDHAGNFDQFPAARLHLQDSEVAFATGRHMAHRVFAHSYGLEDVLGVVRCVYAGRVIFHDGDALIAPGISVHHIGGHTMGLQCVRVWTRLGWLVLASDAAHYYANMEQERPFPTVFDVGRMVQGYRRLRELADAPQHVVPGHDPLVMRRYQPPAVALEGIVVRLDAEPDSG
jgi:glyoxylase-like metal-dependent hydrolase (beta-lactamase superfamily II)